LPRQVARNAEREVARAEQRIQDIYREFLATSRTVEHTEGMATKSTPKRAVRRIVRPQDIRKFRKRAGANSLVNGRGN
jgi:hypothetical protein